MGRLRHGRLRQAALRYTVAQRLVGILARLEPKRPIYYITLNKHANAKSDVLLVVELIGKLMGKQTSLPFQSPP